MTCFSHHLSIVMSSNVRAPTHPSPDENAGKGAGFRHQAERAAVAEELAGRTDEGTRDARGGSAPTRSIRE